jgi:iron complex transport system substrate-binding protein
MSCRPRARRLAAAVATTIATTIAVAAALVGVGCGRDSAPRPAAPAAAAAPALPRLGVLSPSAAEILARLDAGASVIAVGDWVSWPLELASRPALGSFEAPSAERVLALHLDALVTVASTAGRRELAELEALGVAVVALDSATLAGTLASIARLGELVGREREATTLAAEIRAALDAVAARARGAPARRVLVVVGREPLFVAGPGSHFDELVRLAGGVNVAADLGAPYAELSLEAALGRRPEVVLDVSENLRDAPRGRRSGDWARWPFLPAVAANRVFHVDPSRLSVPGPRLPEMADLVARIVQPERFGEPTEEAMEAMEAMAALAGAPAP